MEGPAHEPTFASTVIVDNVGYGSLPGFYNRKAAEQSAVEVALMTLENSELMQNLSQPMGDEICWSSSRTKKKAEINVAQTALLAINLVVWGLIILDILLLQFPSISDRTKNSLSFGFWV